MKTIYYLVAIVIYLLPLVGWGETYELENLKLSKLCFEKSPLTAKVPGASLLPDKICFDTVGLKSYEEDLYLNLQGQPISGEFLLEPFAQKEELTKFLTYIFERRFTHNEKKMAATLRVSVDVWNKRRVIDYIYVVAEFFVYHSDGSYDVHMYYYIRE